MKLVQLEIKTILLKEDGSIAMTSSSGGTIVVNGDGGSVLVNGHLEVKK